MAATLRDSCKTTSASLFCKADSAYLCIPCDGNVHAANKLASRHERLWMSDVCEQAPATVTCKADSAALCATCDRDIHSANPLARRHERFPVVPVTDLATAAAAKGSYGGVDSNDEAEEAEAALWLLPNPNINKIVNGSNDDDDDDNNNNNLTGLESEYLCKDIDLRRKVNRIGYGSQSDGVVPVQSNVNNHQFKISSYTHDVVEGVPAYDVDYVVSKPVMYNFAYQSIGQSVSSSSLEFEVGVVPDHNTAIPDALNNNNHHQSSTEVYPTPLIGPDREARVLRYKEKKKNRKFEKTIQYASRKAYAETRPRIKGRFAKRSEMDVEGDDTVISPESLYGVVPSY
ncbi:zinc finger protein CONSTANS-LIKE 3-like [Bidens hawaiensis]|uniref:zinc finger protein CONSTANS-LIKE 3-like n=1 Tax=Bidens hawaiensis TaxID=980011 RepID=UPI00404970C4